MKDEQLLRDFFGEHKAEIPDNGFSEGVMRRLPQKEYKTGWIVPVFTLIGIALTVYLTDFHRIISELFNLVSSIPLYYLVGGFMLFPIVLLFIYLYWERTELPNFKF